jgi:hypothetical protein
MFTVFADKATLPVELSTRRDAFTADSFSPTASEDAKSGTVTLRPGARVLRVSNGPDDYELVRVFSDTGQLIGTMRCARDGIVTWSTPLRP